MNRIFLKLGDIGSSVLKFGKRNATSIMTGGGILLGWTAAYLFWKESRKAEDCIRQKEAEGETLSNKEKFIIYLQYCYLSAILGLASTGLSLYSHKLSMDQIAKWYMVSQFMEGKIEDKDKYIEKLEMELPNKKVHDLQNDLVFDDEESNDRIMEFIESHSYMEPGIVFDDLVTRVPFTTDILDVTTGISKTNETLRNKRDKSLKNKSIKVRADKLMKDPFFASDKPYSQIIDLEDLKAIDEDDYPEVYSSVGLDIFLNAIHEIPDDDIEARIGEILEFRYFGGGDLIKEKDILKFVDDKEGKYKGWRVCKLDYSELLSPSCELIERNPL